MLKGLTENTLCKLNEGSYDTNFHDGNRGYIASSKIEFMRVSMMGLLINVSTVTKTVVLAKMPIMSEFHTDLLSFCVTICQES